MTGVCVCAWRLPPFLNTAGVSPVSTDVMVAASCWCESAGQTMSSWWMWMWMLVFCSSIIHKHMRLTAFLGYFSFFLLLFLASVAFYQSVIWVFVYVCLVPVALLSCRFPAFQTCEVDLVKLVAPNFHFVKFITFNKSGIWKKKKKAIFFGWLGCRMGPMEMYPHRRYVPVHLFNILYEAWPPSLIPLSAATLHTTTSTSLGLSPFWNHLHIKKKEDYRLLQRLCRTILTVCFSSGKHAVN